MTKTVLGIIGGSGVYQIDGLENARWQAVKSPWGEPSDQLLTGTYAWRGPGVPAAPWPRPYPDPDQHQLPRQYRRPEAHRRHRCDFGLGLRLAEGGIAARHLRDGRPVHRPHLRAREKLLRPRLCRPCAHGPSGLSAPVRRADPGGAGTEDRSQRRRHLYLHGRAAILHPRRKLSLSLLGLQRDRHDRDAGSQAGARGRAALRHRRHGDRL